MPRYRSIGISFLLSDVGSSASYWSSVDTGIERSAYHSFPLSYPDYRFAGIYRQSFALIQWIWDDAVHGVGNSNTFVLSSETVYTDSPFWISVVWTGFVSFHVGRSKSANHEIDAGSGISSFVHPCGSNHGGLFVVGICDAQWCGCFYSTFHSQRIQGIGRVLTID